MKKIFHRLFEKEGKKSQMQVESHAQQQSGYNAIIKEDEGNGGSGSFSNNFKAINYVFMQITTISTNYNL